MIAMTKTNDFGGLCTEYTLIICIVHNLNNLLKIKIKSLIIIFEAYELTHFILPNMFNTEI